MKGQKPFTVLLAITLVVCVFVVIFNFVLRDSFSVFVRYDYPATSMILDSSALAKEPQQSQEMYTYESHQPPEEPAAAELPPEQQTQQQADGEVTLSPPAEQTVQFPLELNTASYQELLQIPKVGEVTATRILEYRDVLGGYRDISQLLEIKGIGEVSFATISAYVYVTGDDWDKAQQDTDTWPINEDLEGFTDDSNG